MHKKDIVSQQQTRNEPATDKYNHELRKHQDRYIFLPLEYLPIQPDEDHFIIIFLRVYRNSWRSTLFDIRRGVVVLKVDRRPLFYTYIILSEMIVL